MTVGDSCIARNLRMPVALTLLPPCGKNETYGVKAPGHRARSF
jgi:hypothetical protein